MEENKDLTISELLNKQQTEMREYLDLHPEVLEAVKEKWNSNLINNHNQEKDFDIKNYFMNMLKEANENINPEDFEEENSTESGEPQMYLVEGLFIFKKPVYVSRGNHNQEVCLIIHPMMVIIEFSYYHSYFSKYTTNEQREEIIKIALTKLIGRQ